MPNSSPMELWVNKRKLDALQEALQAKGSSVEEHMLESFQNLYSEIVPLPLQTQIDQEIQAETARRAAEAEGRRKVTAYRVTRDGQSRWFRTDIGSDILMTALRLKQYLSGPATTGFEDLLSDRTQISENKFDWLAMLRLDGSEQVAGVFDLDFDRAEFSRVDPGEGWRTFPMDSVYSAMCRTERKQGLSHEQMREVLIKNLEGWAIPSPGHIPMCAFEFVREIGVEAKRLTFQIDPESYFDSLDAVFGTNTCTPENNDFLTIRAHYDTVKGAVCDTLEVILHCGDESYTRPAYILDFVEKECLRKKMDSYCQQLTGMELAAYGSSLRPPQQTGVSFGSISSIELMQAYAELCVSDMAKRIMESQRAGQLQAETDAASDTPEPGQEPEPDGHGMGPMM